MRFDRLVAGLAAAGLALPATALADGGHRVLWIALCHGGRMPISIPTDGAPGKDAPAGCHAACLARREERS